MLIYIPLSSEINSNAINLLTKEGYTILKDKKPNVKQKNEIEVLFIRTYTLANKDYLSQFPNLKFVLRAGVGLDNLDINECKKRNIIVINAPGSNANAVAELVIGLMIMLLRNVLIQREEIYNGKWRKKKYIGTEMKNKTIGIVGCGAIGRLIAKKLQSFEVKKILGYDPFLDAEELKVYNIQKVDLKTVIKQSDLITLHIPLLPETKYMISLSELQQMRSSCCLINTSRGGIVKETDLIKALQKKIIHGAAADVFENEPEINKSLLKLPNFIATPHIAGYTEESDIEMSMMTVNKFLQIINGH